MNTNESTIVAKIKDLFCKNLNPGCGKGSGVDEVKDLTCQFHTTLRAYITKIEETAPNPVPKALERIREIIKREDKDLSWQDAYEIEQQLVQLYDEPTLHVEIERRLLDAERLLPATVANWYRKSAEALQDPKDLAALLSSLIDDLQWRYMRNKARRTYTKDITKRTEIMFLLFVFVFVFVFASVFLLSQGVWEGNENWMKVDSPLLLLFAGSAGAFGAAFSMMTGLRKRLADSTFDDLKLNRCWGLIGARVLVGIGAGFVLFFFVRSGLLEGDAFPDFSTEKNPDVLKYGDFAKLFIGCFIAGFSERFVPNLLSQTEGRSSKLAAEPPQFPKAPPAHTTPPTGRSQDHSKEDAGGQSKAADVTRNQGQDHSTENVREQSGAKDGAQSQ